MTMTDEQRTFRLFLRIVSMAQFATAVYAAAALVLVLMLYSDAASRAANPTRAAELSAPAAYRPAVVCLSTVAVLALAGNFASGVCIWRQRGRRFSIGIAAASLLLFPVGTVIGLATLVALRQNPIRTLYEA